MEQLERISTCVALKTVMREGEERVLEALDACVLTTSWRRETRKEQRQAKGFRQSLVAPPPFTASSI